MNVQGVMKVRPRSHQKWSHGLWHLESQNVMRTVCGQAIGPHWIETMAVLPEWVALCPRCFAKSAQGGEGQ